MKSLHWLWFTLMCRFKRVALPGNVNRYAVRVTAKKPFFQWAKRLPHIPQPPQNAQYGKVILLPFGADPEQEAAYFEQALPFIVLDLFSDFDVEESDLPDLSSRHTLHQWFDFERIQGVMDYSTGHIRTELYRFQ